MGLRTPTGDKDNPTWVRADLGDGRLEGTDGTLWVYRTVPLYPVLDAKDPSKRVRYASHLMRLFDELAAMPQIAPGFMGNRATSRGSYREVHMLQVNWPVPWRPGAGSELREYHRAMFPHALSNRRVLLVGVRAQARMLRKTGSLRERASAFVDSAVEQWIDRAVPLDDYAEDVAKINAAFNLARMEVPARAEMDLAMGWWNAGKFPDQSWLVHGGHLHAFLNQAAESAAATLQEGTVGGRDQQGRPLCAQWDIPGSYPVTLTNVYEFDLPQVEGTSDAATWAADLLGSSLAVSIRAKVEPPKVTAREVHANKSKLEMDDIRRRGDGRMTKADQEILHGRLAAIADMYDAGGGYPVLTDLAVTVALEGVREDLVDAFGDSRVHLTSAKHAADPMNEMMLCSPVRANKHHPELSSSAVAYAGLNSLSVAGDRDGALVGFTQYDRQPVYVSPVAVAEKSTPPLTLIVGATGSGKTMLTLWLTAQMAMLRGTRGGKTPVVLIDPKAGGGDFTAGVIAAGGRVVSLDDLTKNDGICDPIRTERIRSDGVAMAAKLLVSIDPWGGTVDQVSLLDALTIGVNAGATCTGQALRIAAQAKPEYAPMVAKVETLYQSLDLFRAVCGFQPDAVSLSVADGLTLIRAGQRNLVASTGNSIADRVDRVLLQQIAAAAFNAMVGRDGVLAVDEAWMLLADEVGRTTAERWGRLARSQRVLPMLATQKVREFLDAGLVDYVSRVFLLATPHDPVNPDVEHSTAIQALTLMGVPPTQALLTTISANADDPDSSGGAVEADSLTALFDQDGRCLRGAITLHKDLSGRVVPVEVTIPTEFLRLVSTAKRDVEAREAALQAGTTPDLWVA